MCVIGSYSALKICPEELKFLLHWKLRIGGRGAGRENVLVRGLSSSRSFLSDLPPLHLSWNREIQREIAGEGGLGTVLGCRCLAAAPVRAAPLPHASRHPPRLVGAHVRGVSL